VTALGCLARTLKDLGRAADADAATARGAISLLGDVPETPRGASPALAAAFDAYARDLGFARGDLEAHASALEKLADRCDEEADSVRLLASRLPIGSTIPLAGVRGTVELMNGEVIHQEPDEVVAPVFTCDPLLPDPDEIDDAQAEEMEADGQASQQQYDDARARFEAALTPAVAGDESAQKEVVAAMSAMAAPMDESAVKQGWAEEATVAALPPAQEAPPAPLTVEEELGVEAPGTKKRPARKARAKKAK